MTNRIVLSGKTVKSFGQEVWQNGEMKNKTESALQGKSEVSQLEIHTSWNLT